jgi:hypothetical protein
MTRPASAARAPLRHHAPGARWPTWRWPTTPTACARPAGRQAAAQREHRAGADRNTDLHINTYAITLGVRGSLWPNAADPFVTFRQSGQTPVGDTPSMIDDLWHATINGRGRMYLATTPEETAASIRAGLEDILSQQVHPGRRWR